MCEWQVWVEGGEGRGWGRGSVGKVWTMRDGGGGVCRGKREVGGGWGNGSVRTMWGGGLGKGEATGGRERRNAEPMD